MSAAPGLYVHVPFCARVCPYCDFAVQTGGPRKRHAYARSLLREIRLWADRPRWGSEPAFDTVYFGGGTPSSLALDVLESILTTLREAFSIVEEPGITLEANPEDIDEDNLSAWRALGVSRLSLGVQSFDDVALETLGRSHRAEQATAAVERALAAGFEAVSIDLIFAVPGQTRASWESSLQQAVGLRPQHISCYELTVHERTRFYQARARGDLVEVSEDDKAEQFFATHRLLADAGYPAYEVSNFAAGAEYRSRHNAKYWDHTPYLGLGPSAHSFDGKQTRWWSARRLIDWQMALERTGRAAYEEETLTPSQLVLEALALGLRTTAGVDLEHAAERYGVDLQPDNRELIERLVERRLLQADTGPRLVPTLEGLAVADALAGAFEIPSGVNR